MGGIADLGASIELINQAQTAEGAFDAFCGILTRAGYDRVTYSLVTDHPSLDLPQHMGFVCSYPEDWIKHYVENNYMPLDPVVDVALQTRRPFFWQDLIEDPDIPKEKLSVLKQGEDAGVAAGIGFSLTGVGGEIVGVGIAKDKPDQGRKDYEFMASAHLLSTYFHESFRDLMKPVHINIDLTQREYDILSWAAEGKNNQEIAIIIGITVHTVRFHWKNIFCKLGANDRIYAVTKAIRLGLVTPRFVNLPHIIGS